jgi:uncharacterized protein (DUF302 family)
MLKAAMATRRVETQRFSVTSSGSYENVLIKLRAKIGHPDMAAFQRDMAAAPSYAQVEAVVQEAVGAFALMEFATFQQGEVLRKQRGPKAPKSLRILVGNPLIMKQMIEQAPDAGSYAPVTILVDERADGVHLSYDRTAGFLAAYENQEALRLAKELDAKIEALLTTAAQ